VDCGIKTIDVPWARSGSGFTLLFEALIMMMAKAMPVKSMANIVKEHDTRLWRVLTHYVHESRQGSDFSAVTQVGVDETSSKRGHNYVSETFEKWLRCGSEIFFASEWVTYIPYSLPSVKFNHATAKNI